MPKETESLPQSINPRVRKAAIDDYVDRANTGAPKEKAKPAYVKPATPERNGTYSSMEERIYGSKSAKTKR